MSDSDDYWDEDEFEKELYDPDDDPSTGYIKYHEGDAVFVVLDVNPEEQDAFIVKGTVVEGVYNTEKTVRVYLRENLKDVRNFPMSEVFDNLDNAEELKEKLDAKKRPKTPAPPPRPKTPAPPPKPKTPKPQKRKTNPKTRRIREEDDEKITIKEHPDGSHTNIISTWKGSHWVHSEFFVPAHKAERAKKQYAEAEAGGTPVSIWQNQASLPTYYPSEDGQRWEARAAKVKTPKKGVAGTGLTNAEIRAKIKARKEAVKAVAKTPKPMTKEEILKKKFEDDMKEFEAFLDEDTPTQATILPPLSDSTKKKAMPTFTPEQLMARERRRKFSLPSI